jgi:hypothetical protein
MKGPMRKLFIIAICSALLSSLLDSHDGLSSMQIRRHSSTSYTASKENQKALPALVQNLIRIPDYCCRSTSRAEIGCACTDDPGKIINQDLSLYISGGFSDSVLKPPCFFLA